MSVVNTMAYGGCGLAVLPEQHAEVWAIIEMYFCVGAKLMRRRYRRTKNDATYSKRPLSRYSTRARTRRAGLGIQKLFRMKNCIDFGRSVFLGEGAQKGGKEVELRMQTSSTSQNDKQIRRSRPSQNRRWVQGSWASALGLLRPIAGAGIAAEVV